MEFKMVGVFELEENKKIIQEKIQEAIKKKDFDELFMLVGNHNKLDYFLDFYESIPRNELITHFRDVYTSTEYGFDRIPPGLLGDIYKDYRQTQITDETIIYRGYTSESTPLEKAYSWTTKKEVAERFAKTNDGKVAKAKVKAEYILDFIEERNEYEVLVLPGCIEILDREVNANE